MDKASIISDVAATLNVPADWLDGVIAFESRYDPQATAGMPYNQKAVDAGTEKPRYARGLIQFIDSTAQDLGFGSANALVAAQSDFESQMKGAVLKYFSRKMPFVSKADLYMAVFYPAYRKKPADTVFPDSVLRANPGINTPQDYIDHADRVVASIRLIPAATAGVALFAGAVVLYLFMKGNV